MRRAKKRQIIIILSGAALLVILALVVIFVVLPLFSEDKPPQSESGESTEPAESGEPAESTEPTEPDEPAESGELAEPANDGNISQYIEIGGVKIAPDQTIADLSGCGIGDAELAEIGKLANLTMVDLSGNRINDITPLFSLPNLKILDLRGNDLIQTQIDELQRALPRAVIAYTETGEGEEPPALPGEREPPPFPGELARGAVNDDILLMQRYLNAIRDVHPEIPELAEDGSFGPATENAVQIFQGLYDLDAAGIINRETWDMIIAAYTGLQD